MKKIYRLSIKNFKAFQEEEVFEFKGKNVLVYGNNGSGKSSLFWALYTFLQSSIKESDDEVAKYFDNTNPQSLLNIFTDEEINAKIEMTYIDEETLEKHTNIISKDIINTLGNQTIKDLNLASDFINYKLLHNFYNASHKQEINLWSVFERDIFAFYIDGAKPILEKIKNKTESINGRKTQVAKERKKTDLDAINLEIEALLINISSSANEFLKRHFYDNKDVIKVNLEFNKKFTLDNINKNLWSEGNDPIRHSELHIKLIVEQHTENFGWKALPRVQSFLNEAQLTRIAIAIRIGALRSRPQEGIAFKILVLDDMLNSLDMENRVNVMRIILNKENNPNLSYFDSFQKIILTHDKGFFDLIRRHTNDDDWVYYKFTKDETSNTAPKVKKELTHLQKAQKYFDDDEFESCGNELRKEAEAIFSNYLDPEMKKVKNEFEALSKKIDKAYNNLLHTKQQRFQNIFSENRLGIDKIRKIDTDIDADTNLSPEEKTAIKQLRKNLYEFLFDIIQSRDTKEKHIKGTKEILDRVLNGATHHTDNPLHSIELKDAIVHMRELKNLLEN